MNSAGNSDCKAYSIAKYVAATNSFGGVVARAQVSTFISFRMLPVRQ